MQYSYTASRSVKPSASSPDMLSCIMETCFGRLPVGDKFNVVSEAVSFMNGRVGYPRGEKEGRRRVPESRLSAGHRYCCADSPCVFDLLCNLLSREMNFPDTISGTCVLQYSDAICS
jgi:hypothetical protein